MSAKSKSPSERRRRTALLLLLISWPCLLVQASPADVAGKVISPTGLPSLPPGTLVTLDDGWGHSMSQLTASGVFEFSGVRPGKYTIKVTAPGFQSSEQRLEVGPREGIRLHVELELGDPIAGDSALPPVVPTVPLAALEVPKAARRELDQGLADLSKGKPDSALGHFETARSIYPDWAQPHAAAALAHLQRKRDEEAETALRRAAALSPEWYLPWKYLGYVFVMTGRHEGALDHLERARRLQPRDASTLSYRGEALYRLGRYEEAAEALKTTLELNSENLHAGYRLGYVLLQLGQRREALAAFERFLQKHQDRNWEDVKQLVAKLRTAQENQSEPGEEGAGTPPP